MKTRGLCSILLAIATLTLIATAALASEISLSATHQLTFSVIPTDGGPAPIIGINPQPLSASGIAFGGPDGYLGDFATPSGVTSYTYAGPLPFFAYSGNLNGNPTGQLSVTGVVPCPNSPDYDPFTGLGYIALDQDYAVQALTFVLPAGNSATKHYQVQVSDQVSWNFSLQNSNGYQFVQAMAGVYAYPQMSGALDPYIFEVSLGDGVNPVADQASSGSTTVMLYNTIIGINDSFVYEFDPNFALSINGLTSGPDVDPAPLPGTLVLMGSGLLGLGGWRRFRKS
jgi:hypothetical protein